MNTYKIILLDTPIIVSSEEIIDIKTDEIILESTTKAYFDGYKAMLIISGLPNQKPIDWNGFESQLNDAISLSDKRFSESEMLSFAEHVKDEIIIDCSVPVEKILKIWKEMQQPKQFQIEVEETENSFKIVKVS